MASFSLVRYPWTGVPMAMVRFLTDRRHLRRTPGLRFARQLGTGRGAAMGLGGDLRRWALVAVWDDDDALGAFLADSPVTAAWHHAEERYTVRLRPLSAHGTWGGTDPFAGLAPAAAPEPGPVAVLTRATLPLRSWRSFYAAVPPVEAALHAADGVLAVVGVGELPVGLQATFSLWRSAAVLEAFAYGPSAPHADVVRRTRAEGWFAEELFARFEPYGSAGTWDGRDPLAGVGTTGDSRRAEGNGS